jgi:acetyl esterase/lipase
VAISEEQLERAATLLQDELGQDGIRKIGGRKWWQWRKPGTPLKAEWIEMRADYNERKRTGESVKRVMLYVHGGAYFFGSVDEHRYQMQRHARKLKARVFAPRYRLAPQFPFPCGLHDCLAAYLYLLTIQEPNTIILAGDSAGGGMVLSLLVTLRNRGIPLPAGAVLISPWVDLTHSFPSVARENPFDYIPASGFHHKPSRAWPPPNEDDVAMMKEQAMRLKNRHSKAATRTDSLRSKHNPPFETTPDPGDDAAPSLSQPLGVPGIEAESLLLSVTINGERVKVKDQIQVRQTREYGYMSPLFL